MSNTSKFLSVLLACLTLFDISDQRCIKIHINIDSLPVRPGAPPSLYPFSLQSCLHILRRDHTLSSDLPLMRFFFISPQQKISSLHTGNETDSEFKVFSKRMTFWNIKSNFICFSLHTRSSSCQLGKCTRKLLLIPLIAMKSGNALDLPLSGISLNTSIVLDCMI